MSKTLTPINLGLDYQAVWFWRQACRLFQPSTPVLKVVFESNELSSFDDVVVYYNRPIPDERGDLCNIDCYQLKYHVDHAGSIGYRDLIEPSFIGATKYSLLNKLQLAQERYAPEGQGSRFYLVSPWHVNPDDPLAKLVSNHGGEIRMEVLRDDKYRKVRYTWKEHLNVDDSGLERILRTLRIHVTSDLNSERTRLNEFMVGVGLIPSQDIVSMKPYEDLVRKCLEQGKNEFTKASLLDICTREGLYRGLDTGASHQAIHLGVRSFFRWAEYMEDATDQMICFLRYFDNRHIRDPRFWNEFIFPGLNEFIQQHIRRGSHFQLHLDTHTTIAFAAGYCLSKSGVDAAPIQYTGTIANIWISGDPSSSGGLPDWQYTSVDIPGSCGNEVAMAISITHEIEHDVQAYVASVLPKVRRILVCSLGKHTGSGSIRDADHATLLAGRLQKWLHNNRTSLERSQRLHIFASAPNGFMFFLGKLAMDFGRVQMYEFDFGSGEPAAYSPSISLPPVTPP
jgi:hypothetical protein